MIIADQFVHDHIPQFEFEAALMALGSLEESLAGAVGDPELELHVALVQEGLSEIHDTHIPPTMLDGYLAAMVDLLKTMRRHVPSLCLRSAVMLPSDFTPEELLAAAAQVEFIHRPLKGRPQ
ncbi:MAG: hypothetical protein ACR652_00830 [Methylocystis sp.]|uniref:hypothetical protein n=1 Tax=Methylocystis sp. TaxID=1911079 RepID=UPI003DA54994